MIKLTKLDKNSIKNGVKKGLRLIKPQNGETDTERAKRAEQSCVRKMERGMSYRNAIYDVLFFEAGCNRNEFYRAIKAALSTKVAT